MNDRLRAWALAKPHVLVVGAAEAMPVAWAVEASVRARGWRIALTPADADLLVVAGTTGPALADAVEGLWRQLPAPRARVAVRAAEDVTAALDRSWAHLLDWPRQRAQAAALAAEDTSGGPDGAVAHEMRGHAGHEMGGHAGHEMGGHAGHEMGLVAGLPMAMPGDDRDGLRLDVLRAALGPLLPGWPAGLVVRAGLSGDVLVSALAHVLDDAPLTADDVPPRAVVAEELSRLLLVTGWETASAALAVARDEMLSGRDASPKSRRWIRRVRRSRTLAWLLAGTAPVRGFDARDRLRARCDLLLDLGRSDVSAPADAWTIPVDDLGGVLEGLELAAARVAVASLRPSTRARVAT